MGFIVCALVIAMLAGSVIWIMPSATQKRLMQLRQSALGAGLRPVSQQLTLARRSGEAESAKKLVLLYTKSRASRVDVGPWLLERGEGLDAFIDGWLLTGAPVSPSSKEHLTSLLHKLPASVNLVQITPLSVGLGWDEKSEGELEILASLTESIITIR